MYWGASFYGFLNESLRFGIKWNPYLDSAYGITYGHIKFPQKMILLLLKCNKIYLYLKLDARIYKYVTGVNIMIINDLLRKNKLNNSY